MQRNLLFIGASLLLETNNVVSAFQPTLQTFSSTVNLSGSSSLHRKREGSTSLFYTSGNDDDNAGFEIRSQDDAEGPRISAPFGSENVPVDQRPSNEYLNLISAPTFGWASQESGDVGLIIRLSAVYTGFLFLVCYPISGATWVEEGFWLQKLTASNVGAMSVVLVLVVRLYSGWGYIGSRLRTKVIEYEESGWYDGAFERKTDAEKARDLFLYRSDVKPVEERLKKFALVLGGLWVASCLAFNVATSSKPIFNQYDPSMLENLQRDDQSAGIVSRESNGRPTYCENRYYRAVANGGQGCN